MNVQIKKSRESREKSFMEPVANDYVVAKYLQVSDPSNQMENNPAASLADN